MGAAALRKSLQGLARLQAEHELELPELIRLKPARRLEARPERLELERRHRLENVELRDQHLENGENALERVLRVKRIAGIEQGNHVIDFVEHLLEPQLVDLVNDDEEHLVVLGPLGARPLKGEQFIDGQVVPVGHSFVSHAFSLADKKTGKGRRGIALPGDHDSGLESSLGRLGQPWADPVSSELTGQPLG